MKTKEAIILAGGLGTRLREVVPDLPKCMASVGGQPFLFYLINQLRRERVEKFIFSLGYKHKIVEDYLSGHFSMLNYSCTVENEPLGTGGATRLACQQTTEENVIVVNGDTLFDVDTDELFAFHLQRDAESTLALKPMRNFDRYGVVELNKNNSIKYFKEKQFYQIGLINGGVYIMNVVKFLEKKFDAKFSYEKDYLERYCQGGKIYGLIQDGYFIDIGISCDYERAQAAFPGLC
ncbi:D-glycero-alpha-D-manno-heptose 1-phosphate guanylyltransferase [Hydrobacter penzbergensis]|uniref:D-glycero-alpha-D-manno-heptose 1-phosphate guanylyltransferase n=1 Tax=Hydrobacter penzbergensis TaxID=1235997 RepID=A0A8X8IFT7_9BACT|nr:nucleotidyltransferase family protein [Hydrobacter penzbergensis]SDW53136.1 D-glycero-alpha-D-manno-heptose 1-phosphate guanylyltransferase [Hydrobacter penzbergensis]